MAGVLSDAYFGALPRQVTIPVVHADDCPPAAPRAPLAETFSGDRSVVGYATFTLCYATGPVVTRWPPDDWPEACGDPPRRADFPGVPSSEFPSPFLTSTLLMRVRCDVEQPGEQAGVAGCEYFGTSSPRSRLVR
jgi:hypothetical protein